MTRHDTTPAKLFLEFRLTQQHEVTIDRCLAKIPAPHLSTPQDRALFVNMLNAILSVPTERCYQYNDARQ